MEFIWDHAHNPTSNCLPPITPHGFLNNWTNGINCSFTRNHVYYQSSSCGGGVNINPSRRSVQGPIRFLNTDYTNGVFLSDNVPVTWSEINLVEVYEVGILGTGITFLNSDLTNGGLLSDKSWEWPVWDGIGLMSQVFPYHNGKPIRIDAYVFIVYDPSTPIQRNETITIDFDCSDTVIGCMDPTAINGTYNPNATVSDPTLCQYPPPEYTVELVADVDYYGGSSGPYTDGSIYTHSNGLTYTTVDFDETANPNGNIQLGSGTTSTTITLPNTYQAGAQVQTIQTFFVYPAWDGGYQVWNFPFISPGGPNANISTAPGYSQRMYYGWGNTKNNLTAASLRIQQPFTGTWESPMYIDPSIVNFSPAMSNWHNQDDPTGLQPTQTVNFNNFDDGNGVTITNSVSVMEIYDLSPTLGSGQYDWFPEKLKVTVDLNFIMPTPQSGTVFSIPINLYHNTENQGDLNWTTPI